MNRYVQLKSKIKPGVRLGRLTMIGERLYPPRNPGKHRIFSFRCDCGTYIGSKPYRVLSGHTKSCGCLKRELTIERNKATKRHGLSRTKEYCAWFNMQKRCSPYAKEPDRADYYGRGIRVCDRWLGMPYGFENFIKDVGPAPGPGREYSLDRINNDGNYEPGNVRWADSKTQNHNQRKRLRIDQWSTEEIISELKRRGATSAIQ